IGTKTIDVYGGTSLNDYFLPGSNRLETFISLSPSEEMRLRFYIEEVAKDSNKLLGNNSYDGVTSGRTNRKLRDNQPCFPSREQHNCTSWIATAPIGKGEKALLTLVGAKLRNEVHTNPGWWTNYLATGAPENRVPVIVYWTQN